MKSLVVYRSESYPCAICDSCGIGIIYSRLPVANHAYISAYLVRTCTVLSEKREARRAVGGTS